MPSPRRLIWLAPVALVVRLATEAPSATTDEPTPTATAALDTAPAPLDPDVHGPADWPHPGPGPRAIEQLPPCRRPWSALFEHKRMRMPWKNSGEARAASGTARFGMGLSIAALAEQDAAAAEVEADAVRYRLCADADVVVWRPLDGAGGAWLAWRSGPAAPLIVEVPHPLADRHTLDEGKRLFRELGARALLVSGSHRCASLELAGCPGQSRICGAGLEPYRASDVAHNHESLFHAMHVALAAQHPEARVISVHGMGRRGAIVSDGTGHQVDSESFVARFAFALAARTSDVRSCNPLVGLPLAPGLCGTSNVQGRQLNGAGRSCHDRVEQSSGRFIHLEQSAKLRRDPTPVVEALREVLAADAAGDG